jgi:hypothetical protein
MRKGMSLLVVRVAVRRGRVNMWAISIALKFKFGKPGYQVKHYSNITHMRLLV